LTLENNSNYLPSKSPEKLKEAAVHLRRPNPTEFTAYRCVLEIIIFIRCEEIELSGNLFLLSPYRESQLPMDVAARVSFLRDKPVVGDKTKQRLSTQQKTELVMSMLAASDITFSQ
jgi:hypothetical protein